MRGLILLLPAMLAACVPTAPPRQAIGFRDTAVPIYSNAVVAPERLTGTWRQVAEFADADAPPCTAGGLTVSANVPGRVLLDADLCQAGQPARFSGPAFVTGPGRLRPDGAGSTGLGEEWWLLWVDADQRTLVIGTPSGRFGMILNRDAVLPPDRMAAAREILAWNGYDLTRLRTVTPR